MDNKVYYTLRFAAAMCFIGHGCFGIITKQIWCNYFGVVGIGHDMAYHLMPLVGGVDIAMGISLLIYPTRAVVFWLVIWGTITALMRPLSGEPVAEVIERAGNFGVPLALLILCGTGGRHIKGWVTMMKPGTTVDAETLIRVTTCLKIVVFLLLAGHGWLNLIEKQGILKQYATLGFADPVKTAHVVGLFELVAAVAVLIRPLSAVLLVLLVWKMGSELFYPQWEYFEWIERGGSYGAILALLLLQPAVRFWHRNSLTAT
ncbi:hypothetical protein BH09BAC6_BH09BAC6_15530 [soil metagenome]